MDRTSRRWLGASYGATEAKDGCHFSGYQNPLFVDLDSPISYHVIMKTTVDIPQKELEDAMRFTHAKTKREAIVTAIQDFNRRRRMAELVKHAGTCEDMITVEELQSRRRKG
jgi:Bacterial antitoxin of type II TA system, VapB